MKLSKFIVIYLFLGCVSFLIVEYFFIETAGLGGIILYPMALFLTLLFAFILNNLIKNNRLKYTKLSIFFFFILQTFLQAAFLPQSDLVNCIEKIGQCIAAYRKYDYLKIEDFRDIKNYEPIAYIQKFKKQLPDHLIIISLDSIKNRDSFFKRKYIILPSDTLKTLNHENYSFTIKDNSAIFEIESHSYSVPKDFMGKDNFFINNDTIQISKFNSSLELKQNLDKFLGNVIKYTK